MKRMGLGAALLGACGGEPPLVTGAPPGEWETFESESFDFHVRPGDGLGCESFVAELERYVAAVRAAFPNSRVGSERAEIYQFASVADLEASGACPRIPLLEGCTRARVAFATPEASEHELGHALFRPAGLPPPLFGEGAAVAVSCRANPELGLVFAARDWREYLAEDERNGWASRFATYLIDEYGADAFLDLYGALPYQASEETVEREFQRVYSEPIDDVWGRSLADPTIRSCMALQACSGEPLSEERAALGRGCGQRFGAPLPDSAVELSLAGQGWGLRSCTASGYATEVALYEEPSFWFSSGETRHALLDYRRAYAPNAAPIDASARPLPGVMVGVCSDTRAIDLERAYSSRDVPWSVRARARCTSSPTLRGRSSSTRYRWRRPRTQRSSTCAAAARTAKEWTASGDQALRRGAAGCASERTSSPRATSWRSTCEQRSTIERLTSSGRSPDSAPTCSMGLVRRPADSVAVPVGEAKRRTRAEEPPLVSLRWAPPTVFRNAT